jgi:hypothetical protein
MVVTKPHQGGINRNAGQPGCKLGPSIKILEMDESIQKTILHCVFCVFAISHHPMNDTEDFFDMAFAKLSEGAWSSSLGGCYQLLLAPPSKIANRRAIALHREKCSRHHNGLPPSNLIRSSATSSFP